MTAVQEAGRPLRADAERNRRRIIEAAARLFARDGLDAGFDDIAAEAGVGVGTVYRRFPDREQLLHALFEDRLEAMIVLVEAAGSSQDAAAGLYGFLEAAVQQHVADRGLKELVFSQSECAERMVGTRERVLPPLQELVERARAQGGLRPDVELSDVMLAVFMASSAGALAADADPQQWRRQLALVWAGLRGQGTPLPGNPLQFDQLETSFNHGSRHTHHQL